MWCPAQTFAYIKLCVTLNKSVLNWAQAKGDQLYRAFPFSEASLVASKEPQVKQQSIYHMLEKMRMCNYFYVCCTKEP